MDYKIEYNNWICNPLLSAEGYEELCAVKDNDEEIKYPVIIFYFVIHITYPPYVIYYKLLAVFEFRALLIPQFFFYIFLAFL